MGLSFVQINLYDKMINNKEISNRLNQDLEIIVDEILKKMNTHPLAILLCGGYGRDEGAWYYDENGILSPYNDYDIAVISEEMIEETELESLRRKLARIIDISWIDIDFYNTEKMKSLKSTIKNYDLIYGSKIIYGKYDLNSIIIDPKQIGEYDIITLYKTRLWTFLGSFKGDFHEMEPTEARFFKNQMAKATLAACDMLLVKSKLYTASYKDRVGVIRKLYSNEEMLCTQSLWALNEKLYPSSEKMSAEECKILYNITKQVFDRSLKLALDKKSKFFLNPDMTLLYYIKFDSYILKKLYATIIKKNSNYCKATDIFRAQNYVYCAYNNGEVNRMYTKEAKRLLLKWGYEDTENEWSKLREMSAYARNNL